MKLAVYGLGRLGYPLFNVLARKGFDVVGVDPLYCHDASMQPPHEPDIAWMPEWWSDRVKIISTQPQPADMSFIVVPTPMVDKGDRRGGFDSSYVEAALRQIHNVNGNGHIAVIVSTLSPGETQLLVEKPGIKGLRVVYNPTFIAIGTVVKNLLRPDMLIFGGNENTSHEVWSTVWAEVLGPTHVHRPYVHYGTYTEIELIKLSVNCVLGTKISLANSLGQLFSAYGVDPKAVNIVGKDHRIGTQYLMPGSPIAGPCLPRDNQALQTAAAKKSLHLPISTATDKINYELINNFFYQIVQSTALRRPKSVGILGTSYKYGVDITTGSTGTLIASRLDSSGIKHVEYDDMLAVDSLTRVLECEVVVVTQKEYEPLVAHYDGKVVRVWP